MKKKRSTLFFIAFLLSTFAVTAISPLPTSISGKVLNANDEPIGGIEVIAVWTDSDGIDKTTMTKTLSGDQANALGKYSCSNNTRLRDDTSDEGRG